MRYRRANVSGGTFFFTLNLLDRSSRLLIDHIDLLRDTVRTVRCRHPFELVAMVVLPDHLHAVWVLPPDDCDYPLRWSLIKSGFSRRLMKAEYISGARRRKRERGIWQRRYWEHQIRDDADLERHVDYIHINPVKHGYVRAPVDWAYSSIHRYIRRGLLPSNWAVEDDGPLGGFGERG
jgi:putative transposase